MKKIFGALTIICAIAAVTTISSCTKTCDTGYEGSDCKTAMNTKFAGTFQVKDTSHVSGFTDTVYNYPMVVTASLSDPTAITLAGFAALPGTGAYVTAKVDGTTFSLASATINASSGVFTVTNLTGSVNGNVISFAYTLTDSQNGVSTDHASGSR